MLTQRPGFINGTFYTIIVAATLAVIAAAIVEKKTAMRQSLPVHNLSANLAAADWGPVAGVFEVAARSEPVSGNAWLQLGQALRTVSRPRCAVAAFPPEELRPAVLGRVSDRVCYDEPASIEEAELDASEGCPVELFDEVALQGFL